jgi:hypothetical protein
MNAFLSGVFKINLGYQSERGFYIRPNLKKIQLILRLFVIDALNSYLGEITVFRFKNGFSITSFSLH